jgi:inner membrane protein
VEQNHYLSWWYTASMLRQGHIGVSLILSSGVVFIFGEMNSLLTGVYLCCVLIFTEGLPDLDTSISFVTHRGITHTLWFAIAVSVMSGVIGGVGMNYLTGTSLWEPIALHPSPVRIGLITGIGGGLGIGSHLLGDLITPWGIEPFAPVSNTKIRVTLTRASNTTANAAVLLVGVVLTGAALVIASG